VAPISNSGKPDSKPAIVKGMWRSSITSGNSGPMASNGARAFSAANHAQARVKAWSIGTDFTLDPWFKMCSIARVIWA